MNPEWKAKWLEALRSGRYTQIKGQLRTDAGFCCLGVLCDLVAPEAWSEEDGKYRLNESLAIVPEAVRYTADFASGTGTYINESNEVTTLAVANDTGKSFVEIAEILDKHF